jgi:hypothetical protein
VAHVKPFRPTNKPSWKLTNGASNDLLESNKMEPLTSCYHVNMSLITNHERNLKEDQQKAKVRNSCDNRKIHTKRIPIIPVGHALFGVDCTMASIR